MNWLFFLATFIFINLFNYDLSDLFITESSLLLGISSIRNYTTSLEKYFRKVRISKKDKNRTWFNFHYTLKNESIITNSIIKSSVETFWNNILENISNDNDHVCIMYRMRTTDGQLITFGPLHRFNFKDNIKNKLKFINYLKDEFSIKSDDYKSMVYNEIIISYKVMSGKTNENEEKPIQMDLGIQVYKKYKLPISMDPLDYGTLVHHDTLNNIYIIALETGNIAHVKLDIENNSNIVKIYRNNKIILNYVDSAYNEDVILRVINNKKYYYLDKTTGKNEIFTINRSTNKYFTKTKPSNNLKKNFITFDFETRSVNNLHEVITACFYDGKLSKSFYLSDFKDSNHMLMEFVKSLCKYKYNHYKVYAHNLGNFDGIFLLKTLSSLCKEVGQSNSDLNIILNKGRIISIDFKYRETNKNKFIHLSFRDSYQIMPNSLRKLCKSFNISNPKTIFPYEFVNTNSLIYEGVIPEFKYFTDITLDDYINYCNKYNNWNLKNEIIKYCLIDCVALYKILLNFNQLFFNNFKININDHATISSHAMRIFRTHFIPEYCLPIIKKEKNTNKKINVNKNIISIIDGSDYKNIRKAYTGGATEMYIPINEKNELIYGYDVNSLYPYIMKNFKLPIGYPNYFEGDITKINNKPFGFFEVEVNCPIDLINPIIQLHVKRNGTIRTISPTGTFKTWIFSEEMFNAEKYGYKFKILQGYIFNQDFIFKDYVNKLYDMRLNYSKTDPMNYISKLLMNSLYGKFGMKLNFDSIEIFDKDKAALLYNKKNIEIIDIIDLDDRELIHYKINDELLANNDNNLKINIAIAAAITAYARIFMSQFKNHPKLKIFYTDTDSIYTNLAPEEMNKLFNNIVSDNGLGKLKLEIIAIKGIFLAPKSYILEDQLGKIHYKVKGLKKEINISFDDFENLLIKNFTITKNQVKWRKSINQGTIEILNQTYTLQQTNNKRELIYFNNKLIGTKPYNLINYDYIDDIINNNPLALGNK